MRKLLVPIALAMVPLAPIPAGAAPGWGPINGGPGPRANASIAYGNHASSTLVFGGCASYREVRVAVEYPAGWYGPARSYLVPPLAPGEPADAPLDPWAQTRGVLLCEQSLGDVWRYDGTWTQLMPGGDTNGWYQPVPRFGASMAEFADGRVVMFGGTTIIESAESTPPHVNGATPCLRGLYDSTGGLGNVIDQPGRDMRVVDLNTGLNVYQYCFSDTWELYWDFDRWSWWPLDPWYQGVPGPSARFEAGATWDGFGGSLLTGGCGSMGVVTRPDPSGTVIAFDCTSYPEGTHRWRGNGWGGYPDLQGTPSGRRGLTNGLTFYPHNGTRPKVLLYGGHRNVSLMDTLLFEGRQHCDSVSCYSAGWDAQAGSFGGPTDKTGPSALNADRAFSSMAYAFFDGKWHGLLFGGRQGLNLVFGDTFTAATSPALRNVTEWSRSCVNCGPPPRSEAVMSYNPGLARVILTGGIDPRITGTGHGCAADGALRRCTPRADSWSMSVVAAPLVLQ